MKIVVVGHRSPIAQSLIPTLREAGFEVVGRGRPVIDVTRKLAIDDSFVYARPDIVINCAAYTDVDGAEQHTGAASDVNAVGTSILACSCNDLNIPLIHFSTDYVFSGTLGRPYTEEDFPSPVNTYGWSKLAGEKEIRACHPKHIILRTAWVYSARTMKRLAPLVALARTPKASPTKTLAFVLANTQTGSPTWTTDLVHGVTQLLLFLRGQWDSAHRFPDVWGTYHCAGSGAGTWLELAEMIVYELGLAGFPHVSITPTLENSGARRPVDSRLDCTKLFETFGIRLPSWRESLPLCIKELLMS